MSKLINVPIIATIVLLIGFVWIGLTGQLLYGRWALKRIPDRRVLLLNLLAAASVPIFRGPARHSRYPTVRDLVLLHQRGGMV